MLILMARFHSDPRLGVELFHVGPILATPVKIVGLFAIFAACLQPSTADSAPRSHSLLGILFFVFAIVPVICSFAFGQPIPNDPISSLLSFGFLLVCTRRLISTQDRLIKSVRIIVVASTIGSMWLYKQHYLMHVGRPDGIEGDCNYEALTLLVDLPLAVWMAIHERRSYWRRVGVASTIVTGIAIVLTQSRAGLIALGVAGLTTVLYSQRRLLTILMVCTVILLVVVFAPSSLFQRFHSISISGAAQNGDEVSTQTHFELVRAGINMIESHPLFGVGLDRFKAVAPEYNADLLRVGGRSYIAHNTYIQIGAECGLPVLLLFLALLAIAMANCRVARKVPDGPMVDLASAIQIGLIGFCVAGASVTAEFVTAFWILVFLSQNLREIATHKARETEPAFGPKLSKQSHPVLLCNALV